MKLVYIVNARIPTEKAHGYQICKMCEQFSIGGLNVELLIPSRRNHITQDVFEFYNIKKNFEIKRIKSFDWMPFENILGRFSFYLQKISFLFRLIFVKISKDAIIYSREPEIVWFLSLRGNKTVFNAHNWPESKEWLFKKMLKNVDKIVCNSFGTEKKFNENGFNQTLVVENGVDIEDFDSVNESKNSLREKLNLPKNKKIALYLGHLYEWKGLDVIISAAEISKSEGNDDLLFVVVGGTEKDIDKYSGIIKDKRLDNVILTGYKSKKYVPSYLKSADILLLPNVPVSKESVHYTSPIKMFEYMASRVPIISSDLPSMREVLNNNNSLLIEAGNAESLVRWIGRMLSDTSSYQKLTDQAYLDVKNYTWEGQARKIIKFITNN